MTIRTFQKKPLIIQAVQFPLPGQGSPTDFHDILVEFIGDSAEWVCSKEELNIINSRETMIGVPGDWVIRGIHGEFYICPHDLFEDSYDEVIA